MSTTISQSNKVNSNNNDHHVSSSKMTTALSSRSTKLSQLYTTMIEIISYSIINFGINYNHHETTTTTTSSSNILKQWKKRHQKIKDFYYFWNQFNLRDSDDVQQKSRHRLYFYSLIVRCYELIYPTLLHKNNNTYTNNSNDNIKTWNQLCQAFDKLYHACMDPKSNLVLLPTILSPDQDHDDDDDEDKAEEDEIIPSQESYNRNSTNTKKTRDEMKIIMKQFEKKYMDIQMKLSFQQCLQSIRNDLNTNQLKESTIEYVTKCMDDLQGRFQNYYPKSWEESYTYLHQIMEACTSIEDLNHELKSIPLSLVKPLVLVQEMDELIQKWFQVCIVDLDSKLDSQMKRYLSCSQNQMKRQRVSKEGEDEDDDDNDDNAGKMMTMTEQELRQRSIEESDRILNLEERRNNLKQIVVDPLPEIISKASTAQIPPAVNQTQLLPPPAIAIAQQGDLDDDNQSFYSAAQFIQPVIRKDPVSSLPTNKTNKSQKIIMDDIEEDESSVDQGNQTMMSTTTTTTSKSFTKQHNIHLKTPETPKMYRKKKTARQEKFDSSQSQRSFDSLMDSPGDNIKPGNKRKKRRFFSEEELDAIKQGVRKFGVGKWSRIRSTYAVLNGRDPVSIKDCYRNMLKRNEV